MAYINLYNWATARERPAAVSGMMFHAGIIQNKLLKIYPRPRNKSYETQNSSKNWMKCAELTSGKFPNKLSPGKLSSFSQQARFSCSSHMLHVYGKKNSRGSCADTRMQAPHVRVYLYEELCKLSYRHACVRVCVHRHRVIRSLSAQTATRRGVRNASVCGGWRTAK